MAVREVIVIGESGNLSRLAVGEGAAIDERTLASRLESGEWTLAVASRPKRGLSPSSGDAESEG